jgi:hypothetical protein
MIPARQVAAAMAITGGWAALGGAVLALTACAGQHTSAPATASPAASSPTAHSSSAASVTADALHLPNQLLGLDKNTSRTAKQAISVLNKKYFAPLAAVLVGGKTAIYGGGQNAATPFFFVVAGELPAQVASPDNAAQRLQKSWSARGIDNVRLFSAGTRGAPVVCGQTQNKDIMCSWVDHVSFGYVLYSPGFASSLNKAASETSRIRSGVVR